MADFEKAFEYMLLNEDYALSGSITMDNNGALVRYGVNAAANPSLVSTGYFAQNTDHTPKMPNASAIIVARNLYNTKYWGKIAGDKLVAQAIASKMLDCEVNTGDAPKLLQHYLKGINPIIEVDGIIGPVTLGTANRLDPMKLLAGFILWWNWYIDRTIANNPEDKKYEKGWRARANKYPPLV